MINKLRSWKSREQGIPAFGLSFRTACFFELLELAGAPAIDNSDAQTLGFAALEDFWAWKLEFQFVHAKYIIELFGFKNFFVFEVVLHV